VQHVADVAVQAENHRLDHLFAAKGQQLMGKVGGSLAGLYNSFRFFSGSSAGYAYRVTIIAVCPNAQIHLVSSESKSVVLDSCYKFLKPRQELP